MTKNRLLKQSCNDLPNNYKFNGIDVVKFICAVLVCILHIPPFNGRELEVDIFRYINFILQQYLCRIAVPFYFVTSGFLLYRKTGFENLNVDLIKNYCFKILRLLGTWTFILFIGKSGQLWYLGALVLAVILLSFLIKKGVSLKKIFILSVFFFMIGLLGTSYYGFIEPLKNYFIPKIIISGYEALFQTTRNGIFFGFIFVFMGALFAQKRIVMNSSTAVGGLVISLAVMFFEIYFLRHYSQPKDFNMVASLFPVVFFLFYISTHIQLKDRPIYGSLRIIGLVIFFTHSFVNYFVDLALEIAKNKIGIDLTSFQFVIIICLTTILAVVIERLSKKEKFYWLKYLFS